MEPPSETYTKVPPQEETRNMLGFSPFVLGVFISILGLGIFSTFSKQKDNSDPNGSEKSQ